MGLAGIKLHPEGLFNTRTLIGLTSSGYFVHQLIWTCVGHQINNSMPGKNTPTLANIFHLTAHGTSCFIIILLMKVLLLDHLMVELN